MKHLNIVNKNTTHRHLTMAALRASQDRYSALVENSPDIIYLLDPDGNIRFIGGAVERLLGFTPDELAGKPFTDIVWPEDIEKALWHVNERRTGDRTTTRFELRLRKKRGKDVPFENIWIVVELTAFGVYDKPVSEEGKDFTGTYGVTRDISERKEMEEALRKSQQRYHRLYNNAFVGLYRTRVFDGKIVEANRKMAILFGYDDVESMKADFKASEHYLDPGTREQLLTMLHKNGKVENFEARLIRKDGSVFWANYSAILDPESGHIEGVMTDISEQKIAQDRLIKSKEKHQSILDGISDPLIMLNKDMTVNTLNIAAKDYYKVDDFKNVVGEPCFEGFMGRQSKCKGCELPSAVLSGKKVTIERKGVLCPERDEQVIVYPVKGKESVVQGAVVRITDTTEWNLMQKQLIHSEKMTSLGFLISGIAHEINNPNNFITFNIPILRDYLKRLMPIFDDYARDKHGYKLFGMSYPEFREDLFKLLENIEHGSNRINATVSTLREFSRKGEKTKHDLVDIKSVIEKAVSMTGSKIKRLVKSFEVNVPEGLPEIYTDPEAIEQILINLLINAAQAVDKVDSRIRLDVANGDGGQGCLSIEVKDNGAGMDENSVKKIFEPFYTSKPPGEGTGLGLAICRNLVEGIKGRIEVESEPGIGSTFRVILPMLKKYSL